MKHTAFHNHCIWKLDQVYTPVPNHTKNRIGRTEALSLLTYRTASLCREHPMNLFILWAAIWDKLEQDQEIYEEYIGFCADGVDGSGSLETYGHKAGDGHPDIYDSPKKCIR